MKKALFVLFFLPVLAGCGEEIATEEVFRVQQVFLHHPGQYSAIVMKGQVGEMHYFPRECRATFIGLDGGQDWAKVLTTRRKGLLDDERSCSIEFHLSRPIAGGGWEYRVGKNKIEKGGTAVITP